MINYSNNIVWHLQTPPEDTSSSSGKQAVPMQWPARPGWSWPIPSARWSPHVVGPQMSHFHRYRTNKKIRKKDWLNTSYRKNNNIMYTNIDTYKLKMQSYIDTYIKRMQYWHALIHTTNRSIAIQYYHYQLHAKVQVLAVHCGDLRRWLYKHTFCQQRWSTLYTYICMFMGTSCMHVCMGTVFAPGLIIRSECTYVRMYVYICMYVCMYAQYRNLYWIWTPPEWKRAWTSRSWKWAVLMRHCEWRRCRTWNPTWTWNHSASFPM